MAQFAWGMKKINAPGCRRRAVVDFSRGLADGLRYVRRMPELAEVAWFAQQWSPGLGGCVTKVLCRPQARVFRSADPAVLARGLTGRRLRQIHTRGKQMLFVFENASLGVHLGMTGELLVESRNHEAGPHDHLVIRQARRSLVFRDPRMFGVVRFHGGSDLPPWWTKLPADILSAEFTQDAVARYTARRANAPLKALLLQQEMFPGVGNWMADEILWRCRFHPSRKSGSLKHNEVTMLWRETRKLCRQAMRIIGGSWGDPPASWLFPHRWQDGGRCPRDQTALRREEIGGRTTAWCPICQRAGGWSGSPRSHGIAAK
jgi:formamidopyrimidine-DNA glycosylase